MNFGFGWDKANDGTTAAVAGNIKYDIGSRYRETSRSQLDCHLAFFFSDFVFYVATYEFSCFLCYHRR